MWSSWKSEPFKDSLKAFYSWENIYSGISTTHSSYCGPETWKASASAKSMQDVGNSHVYQVENAEMLWRWVGDTAPVDKEVRKWLAFNHYFMGLESSLNPPLPS